MPAPARHKRRDQLAAALLLFCVLALLGILLAQPTPLSGPAEPAERTPGRHDMLEFDRFSARRERSTEGERLSVSLRLRIALGDTLDCYVFVVARNDQVSARAWSIWPPQLPGLAITASGHFHGAVPAMGHHLKLTRQWERVTATIPHPNDSEDFDTVVVYVLRPDGRILLARPFRV